MRRQTNGKLTIAQRAGVRGLGQVQAGLKDETGELIEKLEGAPVFALTLTTGDGEHGKAAGRLQEHQDRRRDPESRPLGL